MLKVGIVGLGVGFQHLLGYQQDPRCQVSLVADLSEKKLAEARATCTDLRTTKDAWQIIENSEIDVVSIASYDADHFEQIVAAIRSRKHVFIEKPLCQNLRQLQAIKAAWLRHSPTSVLRSNLVLRAAPVYRWLKDQVRSGTFGQLYAFDGEYLYGRLPKLTAGWRGEIEYYSVMAGGGIHLIDLLMWITGQRPESVFAEGNRICTEGSSFRFEDYVAATLRFSSGLISRITANFGCVHGHQHVVRAFGTRGSFLLDEQGPRTQFERDPAPPPENLRMETLPSSKHVLIPDFIDAVVSSINGCEETQTDFDAMSVCFACETSLTTGNSQQIEYV